MSSNSKPFFGGIPYAPDVNRLMKRFGNPEPGLISYEEIEAALDMKRGDSRFEGVIAAWGRRLLKEHNIVIERRSVAGRGVKVLTEGERIAFEHGNFNRGGRQIRKAAVGASMIERDKLTEHEQKRLDHLRRTTASAAQSVGADARSLADALKAPSQLPKASGK